MKQNENHQSHRPEQENQEPWQDRAALQAESAQESDDPQEELSLLQKALFFFLPCVILLVCSLLFFFGMRWLFSSSHKSRTLLSKLRNGSQKEQWYAAYRLANRVQRKPDKFRKKPYFSTELLKAYEQIPPNRTKLQKYLIGMLGLLKVKTAVAPLHNTLKNTAKQDVKISILRTLGELDDPASLPVLKSHATNQTDPGYRQAAIASIGKLSTEDAVPILKKALNDPVPHVRWNAALGLARHQQEKLARPTLKKMLSRSYVQQQNQPDQAGNMVPLKKQDTRNVMIAAIKAVGTLKDKTLIDKIRKIRHQDPDAKVRKVARKTQKVLTSSGQNNE